MKKKLLNIIFWSAVFVLGAGTVLNLSPYGRQIQNPVPLAPQLLDLERQTAALQTTSELLKSEFSNSVILEPITEFRERITKKPFGIYITPQTSPVQPDRFTGYHTGVDVEYEGIIREIPVRAITAGKVVFSKIASGYGGVMILRHNINGKELFALYGHLDPKSMMPPRTDAYMGQIIGFLGDGKTEETDGVRKHLHFAILKKNSLDIRGYVQNKEELEGWYDPLEFYKNQ